MEIYDYVLKKRENCPVFTAENMDEMKKTLTKEVLDKVVAIEMSVVGAMGAGGLMLLATEDGKLYGLNFFGKKEEDNVVQIYNTEVFDYVNQYYDGKLDAISDMSNLILLSTNRTRSSDLCEFRDGWDYSIGLGWYVIAKNKYFEKMQCVAMDRLSLEQRTKENIRTTMEQYFPSIISQIAGRRTTE